MKPIIMLFIVLTSACTSVSAVSPSPVGQPAQGVLSIATPVAAAPVVPAPIVVAPVVSPPAVAPCSVMLPPAQGVSRLLLCVTSDQGSRAVEAAEITYAGAFIGTTDSNGQFLLHLRGYGGTQPLVIYHALYSRSPVRLDLDLREDHVTESVDLGTLR